MVQMRYNTLTYGIHDPCCRQSITGVAKVNWFHLLPKGLTRSGDVWPQTIQRDTCTEAYAFILCI